MAQMHERMRNIELFENQENRAVSYPELCQPSDTRLVFGDVNNRSALLASYVYNLPIQHVGPDIQKLPGPPLQIVDPASTFMAPEAFVTPSAPRQIYPQGGLGNMLRTPPADCEFDEFYGSPLYGAPASHLSTPSIGTLTSDESRPPSPLSCASWFNEDDWWAPNECEFDADSFWKDHLQNVQGTLRNDAEAFGVDQLRIEADARGEETDSPVEAGGKPFDMFAATPMSRIMLGWVEDVRGCYKYAGREPAQETPIYGSAGDWGRMDEMYELAVQNRGLKVDYTTYKQHSNDELDSPCSLFAFSF